MKYKLAIFDWNGTLIDDSFANWAGSNATLRVAGVPEITQEHYRETMDFPLIHFYNRHGVDTDTYLKSSDVLNKAFMDVYGEAQQRAPLRRGAMGLLDNLLDRGVTLMILSNHVQDHLELQLAERHVHAKFKHICGNQQFQSNELTRTTKMGRLQTVMDEFAYRADEAFIIGDSLEEPDIAHHLGMTSISVTWGCFSAARLRKSPTHHVIDELDEVVPILERSVS
jgi:phosphoglycolate phosphatase